MDEPSQPDADHSSTYPEFLVYCIWNKFQIWILGLYKQDAYEKLERARYKYFRI